MSENNGMTRTHYTALAEFAGEVAAGRIAPWEFIEEFANTLEGLPGNFKRDKFVRHANREILEHLIPAEKLAVGDTLIIGDSLCTVRDIEFDTEKGKQLVIVYTGADDDASDYVEGISDDEGSLLVTEFDAGTMH